jgi:iron complex transport system substrate-binding protein
MFLRARLEATSRLLRSFAEGVVMIAQSGARNTRARRPWVRLAAFVVLICITAGAYATGIAEQSARQTRYVTDGLGRRVEIPSHPTRIVTAGRAVLMIADALYMFESGPERIVGIGRIDQGRGNFLPAIDLRYDRKTVLERDVGPEQVVALTPDLVVLKSFMKESLGDGIKRLGIPVIYVDLETPEQYQRDLTLLGDVLGEESRAAALARYYSDATAAVAGAVSSLSDADRPHSLFIYATVTGGDVAFDIPPAGWIQTQMVELAGGAPVWSDQNPGGGWLTIGFEQIAAWDPEKIFLVAYRDDASAIRDALLKQPAWQELSAVEQGEFHVFPSDFYSWDQPDARWALGLQWLATRMHPSRFDGLDLRQIVYRFFGFAYGMSNEQVDDIIFSRLTGDLD